ncbi:MAG: hypothetical protein F4Z78_00730 [Gammaproteobacteria bacterium]|nr:hypothetical protein [Gammaproteobacteria bacterium]
MALRNVWGSASPISGGRSRWGPQTLVKTGNSRLTVDLPREQHRRFKIACTVAGTKMNDEIRRFIDRRCAELETSSQ